MTEKQDILKFIEDIQELKQNEDEAGVDKVLEFHGDTPATYADLERVTDYIMQHLGTILMTLDIRTQFQFDLLLDYLKEKEVISLAEFESIKAENEKVIESIQESLSGEQDEEDFDE